MWSGKDADVHASPPHNLKWTRRYVWNDTGDVGILKDATGAVRQQATCTPVSADQVEAEKPGTCNFM